MSIITQDMKYRQSLMKYAEKYGVSRAIRKYNKARSYIYFWRSRWDGSVESLATQSRKPHHHPNEHTEEEIKWIKDYHRRNPNISIGELYGKLREDKAYSRHPGSLYRVFVRLGFRKKVESTKKKSKHNKPYDTP